MSGTTPITPVRLAAELLERVHQVIDRRNAHRPRARPWTLSEFVRVCLEREMRKMTRSRSSRRRPTTRCTTSSEWILFGGGG